MSGSQYMNTGFLVAVTRSYDFPLTLFDLTSASAARIKFVENIKYPSMHFEWSRAERCILKRSKKVNKSQLKAYNSKAS